MGFSDAVRSAFNKYATFEGLASRSEYWWFYLFFAVVFIGLEIFDAVLFHKAMGQVGILTYEQLRGGRKFAIVGVFVIAAVLTPPDPISQIAMAVPLMGLYEVSVQAVRFLENRRKKLEAARDAAA